MQEAGIFDTVDLERTLDTLTEFIGVLQEKNIRLRKIANAEINGEEVVNINAETTTFTIHCHEFSELCKSLFSIP